MGTGRLFLLLTFIVGSPVVCYIVKHTVRYWLGVRKQCNPFFTAVFFPDTGLLNTASSKIASASEFELKAKIYESIPSSYFEKHAIVRNSTSMIHMISAIMKAKHKLDICVLVFTCSEIADAVFLVKRRGVHVRIILDSAMASCDGSQVANLRKESIPMLFGNPAVMMHHKFAVVDSEASDESVLIFGSLNWTWGAMVSNNESIVITNHYELIKKYSEEFEKLWKSFSPVYTA